MPFRSAGNGPELFFRLDFEAAELAIHYIVNSALFRLYIQLDRLKVCRVLLEIILPYILCGLDQSLSGIGLPVKLYADFCLGSCGLLCYLCCSLLDVLLYFCGYFCCLCFCLFSDSLYVCLRSCGLLCSRCLLCCRLLCRSCCLCLFRLQVYALYSCLRFCLYSVLPGSIPKPLVLLHFSSTSASDYHNHDIVSIFSQYLHAVTLYRKMSNFYCYFYRSSFSKFVINSQPDADRFDAERFNQFFIAL